MTKLSQFYEDEKIAYGKEVARETAKKTARRTARRVTREHINAMQENGADMQFIMKVTQLTEEEILALGSK